MRIQRPVASTSDQGSTTASRFAAGLLVGLLIASILILLVILPSVVLCRLIWGVWPNSTAWGWLGGLLASQIAATALKVALRPPAPGPGSPPNPKDPRHRSAPP